MTPPQRDRPQILIDDYRHSGFSDRQIARALHDLARAINPPPTVRQAVRDLLIANDLPADP